MPQTVPNSPTKGAVEPTVARKASPSCMRLCTLSIARWIDMLIQVLRSTLPSNPVCLLDASNPDSAIKRKGLFFFNPSAPSRTDGARQNDFSAFLACAPILACSYTLVTMTYQLPTDMMTRTAKVIRATRSPPCHSAWSPYGLSTISVVFPPTAAAGAGAVAVGALASAGAAGVAGVAGVADGAAWPCACASGPTVAAMATSTNAANAA